MNNYGTTVDEKIGELKARCANMAGNETRADFSFRKWPQLMTRTGTSRRTRQE